jgi:hypothetical protein
VLGELVKRVINLVVVALAAVTFFLVPLGKKTLFQHLCAVFSTKEASELGRELEKTGKTVVDEVHKEVAPTSSAAAKGDARPE